MNDNVDKGLALIKKYLLNLNTNKFLIVNVNNPDDYKSIKAELNFELTLIKLSDFCVENDELPDFEKFLQIITKTTKNSLVLGTSEYLKMQNKHSFDLEPVPYLLFPTL